MWSGRTPSTTTKSSEVPSGPRLHAAEPAASAARPARSVIYNAALVPEEHLLNRPAGGAAADLPGPPRLPQLSIVIPVYNERANLLPLWEELRPSLISMGRTFEVIFVDDGSTDGTAQALDDTFGNRNEPPHFTFVVARHRTNRGLGAALRSGFAAAQGQVVVTTDSDGTYAFSEIPVLLSYLGPEIDVVTASLHHPAGGVDGVAAYRVLLSRGASAIYRLLVDWQLHTYTALFRAIRRRVIEQVVVESDGFLAVTEFLVKARLMGFRIAEYPAVLRTRAAGESKLRTTRVVLAHLGFQRRVLMHRLHVMDLVDRRRTPGSRESV